MATYSSDGCGLSASGPAEPAEQIFVTDVGDAVDQQSQVELRSLGNCALPLIVVAGAPSLSHRQERNESWR